MSEGVLTTAVEFLQSGTIVSVAVVATALVLVTVFVGSVAFAVLQGREFSLWPFRIGPRLEASSPVPAKAEAPAPPPVPAPEAEAEGRGAEQAGLLSLDHLRPGQRLRTVKKAEIVLGASIYAGDSAVIFDATSGGSRVAVKLFRRPANLDYGKRSHDFFSTEIKSLTRLDHPNIIQLIDRGKFEVWPFLVIEHMEGGTLRDAIDRGGALPRAAVLSVGRQLAEALDFAHAKGVVHGDIKPGNVLLASDLFGRAALGDFGISQLFSGDTSGRTVGLRAMFGSPAYMAPEALFQETASASADIYSFAVVLLEMLAGRTPFGASMNIHRILALKGDVAAMLQPLQGPLGPAAAAVFARALDPEPKNRQTTARALVAELAQTLAT
jgi:serine/threonine-protein kinase